MDAASDQSMLVQLLQTTGAKSEKAAPPMLNYEPEAVRRSYQTVKRARSPPLNDFNPKRAKAPAATNTSSLLELLTEKPANQSSVLQNLLVSGHDSQTGHDLHARRGAKSPCSPRLASLTSSKVHSHGTRCAIRTRVFA